MDGVTIHHGAQTSVADGQGLFKEGGRTVVVEGQFALRTRRTGGRQQQERKETFHHSTGLFSIGHPVMVDTTGMRT